MHRPGQPWLQISIRHAAPEQVEAILEAEGALAITLRDGADEALIEPEPGHSPLWQHTEVVGLFPAQTDPQGLMHAVNQGLHARVTPDWRAELIEDRDWVRAWMDAYQPMRFGENLWICPRHQSVHADGAVVLRLDPGLAFGTGAHASTALCLEWLETHPPRGQQIIDYGCGSGILAIAAVLLGARYAYAVDIDPQAMQATRDNAIENNVAPLIDVCAAQTLPRGQTDVVLANILAGPLIELAPEITTLLRPNATLVLAGLLEHQAARVTNAYREHFEFEPVRQREGWACLVARRHAC